VRARKGHIHMGVLVASILMVIALALGAGPARAANPPTLEESAAAIERVSTERDGIRVVVGHLSRKLRISGDTLQEQRKQTGLNWGQLLIANRLSKEKDLTFDQVVAEFKSGKSWETIATDHKVDLEKLTEDVRRTQEVVQTREEDHPAPMLGDTQPPPKKKEETGTSLQLPGKPPHY